MNKILLSTVMAFSITSTLQASELSVEVVPNEVIKNVVLPHLDDQDVGERFGYTNKRFFDLTDQELTERIATASAEEVINIGTYRATVATVEATRRLQEDFFPFMDQQGIEDALDAPLNTYATLFREFQETLNARVNYGDDMNPQDNFQAPMRTILLPFLNDAGVEIAHLSVPDVLALNNQQIVHVANILTRAGIKNLAIHALGEEPFPPQMQQILNLAQIQAAIQVDSN